MPAGENHSSGTGTLDPVELGYLEWKPEGSPVSIHMSSFAAEGIAADAAGSKDKEVGGLLLGRVEAGERPAVWIERYQTISCSHASGAEFILDSTETAALEAAAGSILSAGQHAVVGLYRSQTGLGFGLRDADLELVRRYFGDASDLILLVKTAGDGKVSGLFHTWDGHKGVRPVGAAVTLREAAAQQPSVPAEAPVERPRRLVPDFAPNPVQPSPSVFGLSDPLPPRPDDTMADQAGHGHLRRWLPLIGALGVVCGVAWFFVQQAWHPAPNSAAVTPTAEAARPIGLYVDVSAGKIWRVSWNPNATALHNKRNVRLFVHESSGQGSDDPAEGNQSPVDLSARDLAAGSYEYRPRGDDVTFRLEVTEQSGRVSAESFRIVKTPAAAPAASSAPAASAKPEPPATHARIVQPKATYKAPAVVAAGIRSRIKGVVPVDVRVEIDTRGRVTSATLVTKTHSDIEKYLASRAVQAAKQWRFEPAREGAKAVAGSQILHFVFER
jgi:hypothetical protein